jgi:hypothetical protein
MDDDKLYYACMLGNLVLVNLMIDLDQMIERATNWNRGLMGACWNGHLGLVNLMISRGATDWNMGLDHAWDGGHLDLVKYMIRLMIKRKIKVDSEYRYLEIVEREEIMKDLLNGALIRDRLLGLGPEFDVIDKYLF